ncbi:thiol reductase thioredoxin [Planotetraspora silvatica]|uniref:Thioredoxin n=1 Tax=Planotetraspora silvatica TaxID=234614 RepID=A0A8J3ULS5_9ACTN|nr:thioredoxin [Planotetraspora silvatica]GII46766.1 thiol reductase thioredoxin [Planotetraspora silvatica]
MRSQAEDASVVRCSKCGRKNRLPSAASGIPQCGDCHQPLPWVTEAGDDDFSDVVEAARMPVVVDFWAPWCAPCRQVSPALEQIAADLAGRLKLVKVNVDDAPRLSERFAVQAIPTLVVIDQGRVVTRRAGAASAPALREWVDAALAA